MAHIFALRDSGLNAFLFSNVGQEPNGTSLTILSLPARLGKDPWEEAADLSCKPKCAAISSLVETISQVLPNRQALHDAHMTASRLVALLPDRALERSASSAVSGGRKAFWLAFVQFGLLLVLNLLLAAALYPEAPPRLAPHAVAAATK